MRLALSSRDQARLQESLRTLLSPLETPDAGCWPLVVCRSLRELLGADQAIFVLPAGESTGFYSEEVSTEVLRQYPSRVDPLTSRIPIWKRHVALGAFSRDTVWSPYLGVYYRSEYYNDYLVPIRSFDGVGLASATGKDCTFSTVAQLLFHHHRPTGRQFGERGLTLLRLLLPAFRAGVETRARLAVQRDRLASSLDALGERLFLCDLEGRLFHQTPALARSLNRDPERERVLGEMRSIARSLCGLARAGTLEGSTLEGSMRREVQTAGGRYRLRGSYLDLLGSGPAIMVALEPLTPELPTEEELRQRFGLTWSEMRVARLLAAGKPNSEIAETLHISRHTAKCHTERILLKLGIHSRAAVSAALLQG